MLVFVLVLEVQVWQYELSSEISSRKPSWSSCRESGEWGSLSDRELCSSHATQPDANPVSTWDSHN